MTALPAQLALAPEFRRPAAYVRISDDRTGENASIARQKRLILALAGRLGIDPDEIVWFEDKSRSASHGKRPQFDALMDYVHAGQASVVLVWVADRLWRNEDDRPVITRLFRAADVPVKAAQGNDLEFGTAEGRFMARVVGAASSFETERKAERIVLAAEDRARKGRFGGGTRRFGYRQRDTRTVRHMDEAGTVTEVQRPSGPLVLVPEEADALAWAYQAMSTGATLRAVTREWRARGLVGTTGAGFTPLAVKQILLRPMNAGLSSYRGEVVGTGDWPAVVDPDTFATVKAILTDPDRKTTRGRPVVTLLTGILVCQACGGPMRSGSKGGGQHPLYRCQSGREAPDRPATGLHSSRRQYLLDPPVSELVLARVIRDADKLTRPASEPTGQVAAAVEEVARLRTKIEAYQSQADTFDPEDLAALLRGLRAKLSEAESRIVKAAGRPATQALLASGDIAAAWSALDTEGRRTVIKENVDRIVVGRAAPGTRAVAEPMHGVEIIWAESPAV